MNTRAGDEEIINVSISKREITKNLVDQAFKCLRGVAETKWHLRKFEESERVCYSRLMKIGWLHRDLMIGSHQIYFEKIVDP